MKSIRKLESCQNKDLREVWAISVTFIVVIFMLEFFVVVIGLHIEEQNQMSYRTYEEIRTVMNSKLNTEQRADLAQVLPEIGEDDIGEGGLIIEHKKPSSFFTGLTNGHRDNTILIFLVAISLASSICYWVLHDKSFYLADLPLKSRYGWRILLLNFVTWPVLLVSLILFLRFKQKVGINMEDTLEDTEDEQQENIEPLPEIEPMFDKDGFTNFYKMLMVKERLLEKTKSDIATLEQEVKDCVRDLKDVQAELSENRAKLNWLKDQSEAFEESEQSEVQIENDFAQIKAMRGVRQIYLADEWLVINVRVEYPYLGKTYDLGDYDIRINRRSVLHVYKVRGDESVGYEDEDGFCFGSQSSEIKEYLMEGRLVEAVELIIDCLGFINENDCAYVPDNYQEIREMTDQECDAVYGCEDWWNCDNAYDCYNCESSR